MACRSCGKNKTANKSTTIIETQSLQSLYDSGNYDVVQYQGRTYTHNIGSPTGVIAQDGLSIYGRGQSGAYLLVHKQDIEKAPNIFVRLSGEALAKAQKSLNLTNPTVAKVSATKSIKEVKEIEAIVSKQSEIDADIKEVEAIAREKVAEGKVIKRSEALSLKDYAEEFGYTHHLQVLAKVKSGELLSYEDENGKPMVYHVEDN